MSVTSVNNRDLNVTHTGKKIQRAASVSSWGYLLREADEVLVIRIHVRELAVDQQDQVFLAHLLALPHVRRYDAFRLLPQSGITGHLWNSSRVRIVLSSSLATGNYFNETDRQTRGDSPYLYKCARRY